MANTLEHSTSFAFTFTFYELQVETIISRILYISEILFLAAGEKLLISNRE